MFWFAGLLNISTHAEERDLREITKISDNISKDIILYLYYYKLSFFNPLKSHFKEIISINNLNKKIFQNILNLYEYPINNLTIITIFLLQY